LKQVIFCMNPKEQCDTLARELGKRLDGHDIKPGDLYLAARNTGAHLLTCHKVKDGYIVPQESSAYCYNTWECWKLSDS